MSARNTKKIQDLSMSSYSCLEETMNIAGIRNVSYSTYSTHIETKTLHIGPMD